MTWMLKPRPHSFPGGDLYHTLWDLFRLFVFPTDNPDT